MFYELRFADDIVFFCTPSAELEEMLEDVTTASLEVGLSRNRCKTQIMTNKYINNGVYDYRNRQSN